MLVLTCTTTQAIIYNHADLQIEQGKDTRANWGNKENVRFTYTKWNQNCRTVNVIGLQLTREYQRLTCICLHKPCLCCLGEPNTNCVRIYTFSSKCIWNSYCEAFVWFHVDISRQTVSTYNNSYVIHTTSLIIVCLYNCRIFMHRYLFSPFFANFLGLSCPSR